MKLFIKKIERYKEGLKDSFNISIVQSDTLLEIKAEPLNKNKKDVIDPFLVQIPMNANSNVIKTIWSNFLHYILFIG